MDGYIMAPYQIPNLPYEYEALEPVISAEIMRLHHTKHHQAYVNNLNSALEKYAEAEKKQDLSAMIALESAIRFNGGGHINHSIFWTNLAPKSKGGGEAPTGDLMDAIQMEFGTHQNFIDKFSGIATGIQGSGWAWLGYNKSTAQLTVATCTNQDPLSTQGLIPLLGIDVWEHAYYLQYKNVRADYVKAIWSIVNWKNVAERFNQAAATCSSCSCR
ncbi:MAG: superoxide dismutase [Chlamydiales bacterium]|nr:superoxide dismutase [Chlamydiales bacterium]